MTSVTDNKDSNLQKLSVKETGSSRITFTKKILENTIEGKRLEDKGYTKKR